MIRVYEAERRTKIHTEIKNRRYTGRYGRQIVGQAGLSILESQLIGLNPGIFDLVAKAPSRTSIRPEKSPIRKELSTLSAKASIRSYLPPRRPIPASQIVISFLTNFWSTLYFLLPHSLSRLLASFNPLTFLILSQSYRFCSITSYYDCIIITKSQSWRLLPPFLSVLNAPETSQHHPPAWISPPAVLDHAAASISHPRSTATHTLVLH